MHALIIEQDVWVILMIEDVLRDLGYTSLSVAMSWHDAEASAHERCPDLVTSDIRLGSGLGTDVLREICAERTIPLVYVTETPWEVRDVDADAVVVAKPFGEDSLRCGIGRATGAGAGERRPAPLRAGT
jgi:DNA-binding response OmpR family regulator